MMTTETKEQEDGLGEKGSWHRKSFSFQKTHFQKDHVESNSSTNKTNHDNKNDNNNSNNNNNTATKIVNNSNGSSDEEEFKQSPNNSKKAFQHLATYLNHLKVKKEQEQIENSRRNTLSPQTSSSRLITSPSDDVRRIVPPLPNLHNSLPSSISTLVNVGNNTSINSARGTKSPRLMNPMKSPKGSPKSPKSIYSSGSSSTLNTPHNKTPRTTNIRTPSGTLSFSISELHMIPNNNNDSFDLASVRSEISVTSDVNNEQMITSARLTASSFSNNNPPSINTNVLNRNNSGGNGRIRTSNNNSTNSLNGMKRKSTQLKPILSTISTFLPKLTSIEEATKNPNLILYGVKTGNLALLDCILNSRNVNNVKDSSTGNSLLQVAIQYNQQDVVAFLLSKFEMDLNYSNKLECTALHVAATKGNTNIITLLLTYSKDGVKKLDWSRRDIYGNAAIHLSCDMGDVKGIETQLLFGVSPTLKKRDSGLTPLHLASQYGNFEIVKLLLNYAIDPVTFVNMRDDNGLNPLMRSILSIYYNDEFGQSEEIFLDKFYQHYFLTSALGSIEKIVKSNARNWLLLDPELRLNYLKIWSLLLNETDYEACCTSKTKANGLNIFHLACISNNVPFMEICILTLPDTLFQKLYEEQDKYEGCSPLHLASWFFNIQMLELLIRIACEDTRVSKRKKDQVRSTRRYTEESGISASSNNSNIEMNHRKEETESDSDFNGINSPLEVTHSHDDLNNHDEIISLGQFLNELPPRPQHVPPLRFEALHNNNHHNQHLHTEENPNSNKSTIRGRLSTFVHELKTPHKRTSSIISSGRLSEDHHSGEFKIEKELENKRMKEKRRHFRFQVDLVNNFGETPVFMALNRMIEFLEKELELPDNLTIISNTELLTRRRMFDSNAGLTPRKQTLTPCTPSSPRSRRSKNYDMDEWIRVTLKKLEGLHHVIKTLLYDGCSSKKIKSLRTKTSVSHEIKRVMLEIEKALQNEKVLPRFHETLKVIHHVYSLFINN
ncbi:hypothetical protein ABK040_014192 [Willaertia magna]